MVTKQEEIREGMVKILDRETMQRGDRIQGVTALTILHYLHSQGVVIKGKRDPKYIALFKVEPLI